MLITSNESEKKALLNVANLMVKDYLGIIKLLEVYYLVSYLVL